jgi:GT2 family glycosyltransferase
MLKEFDVKVITNDMNKSFAISINQGVNESSGEYILALNNDIEFYQPWLKEMLETFSDRKVGVVGAQMLFKDGTLQHAGVACYKNRQPYHVFRGEEPSEKTNRMVEYPAVSFACALFKRSLFESLQGLSVEYPDGNFEDVDFCLRARLKRWKNIYQPKAKLYHLEAGTKKLDPKRAKKAIFDNYEIFKKQWEHSPQRLFDVDRELFPKILVGCPTYDKYEYCLKQYGLIVKNLMYPNYDILLVDNSEEINYKHLLDIEHIPSDHIDYEKKARDRIVLSRNILRKKALKYDYFLSLEQDVIPEPSIIQDLLKLNKKIVSGAYFNNVKLQNGDIILKPVLYKFHEKKGFWGTCRLMTKDEVWAEGVQEVAYAGLGCMLIAKEVLEKIKFRYSEKMDATDDRFFCYDARKLGYDIFADTGIKAKHLIADKFDWDDLREKGEY